ncbi:MAG: hypothetical protein WBA73_15220 [Devosia sp.]
MPAGQLRLDQRAAGCRSALCQRTLALPGAGESLPWRSRSVGSVGQSDGFQQLTRNGRLDQQYQRADDGNVAITAEIGFDEQNLVDLVLGFGQSETEAGTNVLASLRGGWGEALGDYCKNWREWQDGLRDLDHLEPGKIKAYRVSTAVLASHRAIDRPGAVVASLSIPWGRAMGRKAVPSA